MRLIRALDQVAAVKDDHGDPLVDTEGIDESAVDAMRQRLNDATDTLITYRHAWRKRHPRPTFTEQPGDDEDGVDDVSDEVA